MPGGSAPPMLLLWWSRMWCRSRRLVLFSVHNSLIFFFCPFFFTFFFFPLQLFLFGISCLFARGSASPDSLCFLFRQEKRTKERIVRGRRDKMLQVDLVWPCQTGFVVFSRTGSRRYLFDWALFSIKSDLLFGYLSSPRWNAVSRGQTIDREFGDFFSVRRAAQREPWRFWVQQLRTRRERKVKKRSTWSSRSNTTM